MPSLFKVGLFKKTDPAVHDLYSRLVEKARDPAFYAGLGVPDTVDGRFDMIVLHAMLLLRRFRGQGDAAELRGQEVFDLMFKDMDQSLRELGVGDMSVGKHIKRMAQAFYGRAERTEAGLDAKIRDLADTALGQALTDTVFRKVPAEDRQLAALQDYLIRADRHVAAQPVAGIVAGSLDIRGAGDMSVSESAPEFSYVVEIDRIPTAGGLYEVAAPADALARVAARLGVHEVKTLNARFAVKVGAGGIAHVQGKVHAELVQACVVSLAPVPAVIDEDADVSFISAERAQKKKDKKAKAKTKTKAKAKDQDEEEEIIGLDAEDPPEIAEDGRIDLGELAVAQVALVLNPYPRAPGVSFDQLELPASPGGKAFKPGDDPAEASPETSGKPFAVLAKLKKNQPN